MSPEISSNGSANIPSTETIKNNRHLVHLIHTTVQTFVINLQRLLCKRKIVVFSINGATKYNYQHMGGRGIILKLGRRIHILKAWTSQRYN